MLCSDGQLFEMMQQSFKKWIVWRHHVLKGHFGQQFTYISILSKIRQFLTLVSCKLQFKVFSINSNAQHVNGITQVDFSLYYSGKLVIRYSRV